MTRYGRPAYVRSTASSSASSSFVDLPPASSASISFIFEGLHHAASAHGVRTATHAAAAAFKKARLSSSAFMSLSPDVQRMEVYQKSATSCLHVQTKNV